jgi:hypothetical protein
MRTRGVALLALAGTLASSAASAASISELQWLAGCWAGQKKEPGTEEHWLSPVAGSMLGVGRTVRDGRTAEYEFMQIREAAGKLTFIAHPSGQPEATFPLLRIGTKEVVFENAAHDFPQRVIYRLDGGVLRARIEGKRGRETKGINFPMDRVPCEGALQ